MADFTDAQKLAIEHTGSDLLISAGAGSGKTFTLTQRIVERIKAGKDISKMLIVTFTKEAANELKARIAKALFKLNNESPSDRISQQIVKIGSADISTIDSFCYKLVKSNFDKLGLDGGIRIGNSGELDILAKEAMDEVIDEFYEKDAADEDFYLVVDCYSDNKDDEALTDNLLALYNDLSNNADFLEGLREPALLTGDFFDTKYGTVLKKHTKEMLEHYKRVYEYLLNYIKSDIDGEKKFIKAISGDFDIICRALNGVNNCSYEQVCNIFAGYKPENIGRSSAPELDCDYIIKKRNEFKGMFRKLGEEFYSSNKDAIKIALEQNNRICGAMYRVLSCFDERYKKKKSLYSVCSFNDISRYALKLLYNEDGSVTTLAKDIGERYDEIYIDEYQDTNSIQDSIFKAISKNNRFMVGDIKQCIYKFRLAEPEIFASYRNSFLDKELNPENDGQGKSLFMSANFRCNKEIIDFTNMVSDYMFLNSDGIPYQKKDNLLCYKTEGTSPQPEPCEIRLIETRYSDDNSEACQMGQARYVAKTIKELLDKGQLANGKPLKKSDFAILLRSPKYGKADKYVMALKEYGIGAELKTEINFYEKPHILLMLSILNAVDNPYNDVYLAGAMRSSVFGFSLDELIKIRAYTPSNDVPLYSAVLGYQGDLSLSEKIKSFVNTLSTYREAVKRLTANEAIYYLMTETGISSQVGKNERQDLIKLYNQAREFEGGSFKGLYRFLSYVKDNMDTAVKETVSVDVDNVQIMTVHASKGLEFEYCFVCDMEAKCEKTTRSSIIYERSLGIAGHISKDDGIIRYNTLMRKCIDLQKHRSAKDEEMRIIYVAMTRARTKLFITASVPEAEKHYSSVKNEAKFVSPYQIYSVKQDIDFVLGGAVEDNACYNFKVIDPLTLTDANDGITVDADGLDADTVESYSNTLKKRFGFEYRYDYLKKMPSKLSISKLYPMILDGNENDEVRLDKSLETMPKFLAENDEEITAADKGTATHVFMQFCDFNALNQYGYAWELDRLIKHSFISQKTAELINGEHIEKFRGSELFNMMLKAKMIKREFRFNLMLDAGQLTSDEDLKKEKVLVQGVVDCLFEGEDGQLVLVDYKTDKVTEENYIQVLTERHKTQLSYYRKACELMFNKPISKVIIYSVPIAKIVEIQGE